MEHHRNITRSDETVAMQSSSSVLFRETHKNAWLKRLPRPCLDKRTGAFPKRGDRVWVVFCIHDDAEAFLETYFDMKLAVTHKPDWFVSLNNCLHISPTICAQEDEFEFVVTLRSDIVRLAAPSWDTMMDWVETIGSKLREMNILSPRENIYSKMPEARLPLAPTRDPNSPLPLPPAGPSSLLLGMERVQPTENPGTSLSSSSVSSREVTSSSDSSDDNAQAPRVQEYDDVCLDVGPPAASSTSSRSEPHPTFGQQAQSRDSPVPESPLVHSSSSLSSPPADGSTSNNVTIIEVGSRVHLPSLLPVEAPQTVFNFNVLERSLQSVPTTSNDPVSRNIFPRDEETHEEYFTPPVTPAATERQLLNIQPNLIAPVFPSVGIRVQQSNSSHNATPSQEPEDFNDSHYECVFLPPSEPAPHETNSPREAAVEVVRVAHPPSSRGPQPRRRSSSEATPSAHRRPPHEDRPRGVAEGERRLQPAPHPYRQHQIYTHGGAVDFVAGRLNLREQQVLQLHREMLHPGGVRLQLRRKDCTGSIALIDAFGGVWIAGWKQRDHPMLYNSLHIGDQLLSTSGILVQSASDAQKLVRGATSLYVEFVIRRVPFGQVFAIRRDTDGQDLGIVQEGNTAEIRDVLPGSLAARHGLTTRTKTCDGLSLTNWVLTEINGRPLNLFFKESEVRDRLHAIGREISILVQPFDLIKQLKKQLKVLKSYKDYIVQ